MFELSVAFKYLIPRWRQLSVSIISIISTLVIALVVWLIVVFFSVKDGLEGSWIDKIIALTAPIRITPTEKYYNSYYYLVDTISAASDFNKKTISEKRNASATDPYDPLNDEEVPTAWPKPDLDNAGQLKDPVQTAFALTQSLPGISGLTASDYETTVSNLRMRLLRYNGNQPSQLFLEHAAFVGSFDTETTSMAKALIPPTAADFNNLLLMQGVSSDNIQQESPTAIHRIPEKQLAKRLENFFQSVEITALKTPSQGWRLPLDLLTSEVSFTAAAVVKEGKTQQIVIPAAADQLPLLLVQLNGEGWDAQPAELNGTKSLLTVTIKGQNPETLAPWVPVMLAANITLPAKFVDSSLLSAKMLGDIKFEIAALVQKYTLNGTVTFNKLEVGAANLRKDSPHSPIVYPLAKDKGIAFPAATNAADPILLPRTFKESGALLGDQGYLSYFTPTPSSVQEQRMPVYIAGFYDPGIIPIGGKLVLASKELTALIRASSNQEEAQFSNGINIHFDKLADAAKVKAELQRAFDAAGIAPYWQISTYHEFEFTKDIVQQLQSEKNLFSLISLVIIIVACSNIISMLIILVNDKKLEIGILRSMGASSGSIAAIFGICGVVMGTIGSLIGILGAMLTLRYVNELVGLISKWQGYEMFNPVFYGHTLPSELSMEALSFVIATTAFISLLAGIVPAVKASMMRPSAILRSE